MAFFHGTPCAFVTKIETSSGFSRSKMVVYEYTVILGFGWVGMMQVLSCAVSYEKSQKEKVKSQNYLGRRPRVAAALVEAKTIAKMETVKNSGPIPILVSYQSKKPGT